MSEQPDRMVIPVVIAGLDPAIQGISSQRVRQTDCRHDINRFPRSGRGQALDCRVMPGNDEGGRCWNTGRAAIPSPTIPSPTIPSPTIPSPTVPGATP